MDHPTDEDSAPPSPADDNDESNVVHVIHNPGADADVGEETTVNEHPQVDDAFARWAAAQQPNTGHLTWRIAVAIALSHDELQGSPNVRTVADVNELLARYEVPVLARHMHVRRQVLGPNTLTGNSMLFDPEHNGCRPKYEPDYPEKWLWLELPAFEFYRALAEYGVVQFTIGARFLAEGRMFDLIAYAPDGIAVLRGLDTADEILEVDARKLDTPAFEHARFEREAAQVVAPAQAPRAPVAAATGGVHLCRTCGRAPEGGLVDRNGVPLGWKQLGTLQPEGILIEFCSACFNAIRNL